MYRHSIALLAAFFFCMTANAVASDLHAEIQRRYGEMRSFAADFEQVLSHRESGAVERRQGRIMFQKPLKIRWQTARPHEELLVVTEDGIWDYLPDEEIAYRYPVSLVHDSRNIIQVVTGQAALTRDFDVKAEGSEEGLAKLRLYPKEPSTQMVEALVWVDTGSGYIRKVRSTDFYGNTNEIRFTSFDAAARFKASEFTFTPPKGVEIEDRRNQGGQGKELFR